MGMYSREITAEYVNEELSALRLRRVRSHHPFGNYSFGHFEPTRLEWASQTKAKVAADLSQMLFSVGEPVPVSFIGSSKQHLVTGRFSETASTGTDYYEPRLNIVSMIGIEYLDISRGHSFPIVNLVRPANQQGTANPIITLPDLAHEIQTGDAQILWPSAVSQ